VRPFPGGVLPRLFATIILPFSILLFGLAVAAIDVHGKAMRGLVAARDERAARAAAATISEELFHRQIAVRALSLRLSDGVSPARAIADARPTARDFPKGLAVVAGNRRIVAGFLPVELLHSRALTRALGSTPRGAERIAPPLTTEGGSIVIVSSTDGPLSVVGAFTTLDLLRFALPGLDVPPVSASVVIIDPETGVLAHEGAARLETDYRNHPGVRAALEGTSGSSFIDSPSGEEHVLAFSLIRYAGWVLLIEEPWLSVASPLLRLSLIAPLALALALALSLIGLWFAARQVVVPLRSLQRQSLKLAAGDFAAMEEKVGGVQEIRDLQRTMTVMSRRIQSAQQSLRRYIGKVTSAQEEERRRLAQDLHDETIQDLIALDQKVQLVARGLRDGKSTKASSLETIHREAKEAIQRVRRLSRALRPAYLEELGLLPAIEALARDVGTTLRIPVVVRVEGSPRQVSRDADLALYRIVQEALANVARHATADHAWITLRYRRDELRVGVKDDGVGFTPPTEAGELSRTGHFGLIGMRERAQFVGARIEWHSAPGKGTSLTLLIPFQL
jgi:signal transduction histidine kinase